MEITGEQLVAGTASREGSDAFVAVDPATGEALAPDFVDATPAEIDRALQAALFAQRLGRRLPRGHFATLLDEIAAGLEDRGEPIVARARRETGLPEARLVGERARTCAQLRLFAEVVRDGAYLDVRHDAALPDRAPLPRPDLRRMKRPIGPVAVFGASNFPLAFSVAGGDTAAAFAAGCPVVVKAHPHHPGTSELVGRVVRDAVARAELPAGTFSLLQGRRHETGAALVSHAELRACAFTGSFSGGRALFDVATRRPRPIPCFAEMGSINPVFLLPGALAERGTAIAEGLAASMTLGVGQFCTNPGLVVLLGDGAAVAFLEELERRLRAAGAGTMLHEGIARSYGEGIARLAWRDDVVARLVGRVDDACAATPALFLVEAAAFLRDPALQDEVFGPSTLVVRCPCEASLLEVAASLVGQLTATIHAAAADLEDYAELPLILEERVGRLVFDGFPTGVEVGRAMQHGGPWPATTDGRFTSVGTAAVERFLRPVCWQDAPGRVLPPELAD